MRKSTTLNLGTGTFVLLGFAALFFLTTQTTSRGISFASPPHYDLTAKFDNIGDLKVGAPVSMSGVEMGAGDEHRLRLEGVQGRGHPAHGRTLQPNPHRQRCGHLHSRAAGRQVHRHHGRRRRQLFEGQGSNRLYAVRLRARKPDRAGAREFHEEQHADGFRPAQGRCSRGPTAESTEKAK